MIVCRIASLLTLALLLGAAAPATAGRDDRDVLRDVTAQLASYTEFTMFDSVDADVSSGRVMLRGWVTAKFKREDVARRVARVAGVAVVENAIAVLPESQADDVLRYRVAKAIYGHEAFLPYAALPSPPIRIVVDHGRVTLTGVVATEAERRLARSLAAGVGEVEVRDALRTESTLPRPAGPAARPVS